MKNYRTFGSLTVALLAAGSFITPAALKAAAATDSADINKLLGDVKSVAAQLKTDSSQMESFTRSKLSWESYAEKVETIKGHINNAGQLVTKLKAAESTGSPAQQETVKRVEPLLQEMANNLTATIQHLNDNKSKVHFPAFTDYVKANYAMATDLDILLRTAIEYGTEQAKFDALATK